MHSLLGLVLVLSTAAGFTYSGERFRRYFADFEDRYHFHDMYTGGFYPFESLEEYWAYWSRFYPLQPLHGCSPILRSFRI